MFTEDRKAGVGAHRCWGTHYGRCQGSQQSNPECGTLHSPGKQHVASNANAVTLELRGDSRSAAGAKAPGTGTKCHWLEGQRVPPRGLPMEHRKQERTFYSHRDSLYCGRCAKISDDDIYYGGQLILANQDLCLVQTLYWLVLCQIDAS